MVGFMEVIGGYWKVWEANKSVILSELYDLVLPLISRSGRFEQRSLDTLAESYVDLKLLPAKPEMARTYTEQFLPK
jgi:hypothetical protein